MLSPDYFQGADKVLQSYFEDLEEQVLRDVSKNLASATSKNQLEAMIDLDYSLQLMNKKIAEYSNKSLNEIEKLMEASGIKSYEDDKKRYEAANKHLPDFKENLSAIKFVDAIKQTSRGDLKNITRTTGFAGQGLNDFYKKELSEAIFKLRSGTYSSDQVIKSIINKCAERGLQTISYSTRNYSIEAAVRMCVNTGMRNLSTQMGLMNARMMGQDLMEISAHAGARPSHAEWQGQIVSLSGNPKYLSLDDIGYGSTDGFDGINCRHSWYPFFEGISVPADGFIENEPFEYNGEIYTQYEASQRMRRLENSMRKEKRKIYMYEELGDTENLTSHKIKLQRLRNEYNKFSKQTNLKSQMYRVYIPRYNKHKMNVSGAITDAYSDKARKHAKLYYEEIRNQTTDVKKIAINTGYDESVIQEIKNYLFIDKHQLGDKYKRFDEDFYIAQSWQRLAQNNIYPHDLILIKHEIYEKELIVNGMTQYEAHIEASKVYNYREEANKYYAELEKRKNRK